ncbi:MAG: helix-turn-helix domain-containing protein, partial [Mobilitalea sp.]
LNISNISYDSNISFIFAVTTLKTTVMVTTNDIKRPNKRERKLAQESYTSLISSIEQLKSDQAEIEIEIEETRERIILPVKALNLLGEILKAMSQGKPISIVPLATEVTTQKASEILGCSRPYLVKLLEEGKIEYTKVGKHRRIKYEDVIDYKKKMKEEQKKRLIEIMHADEDLGLYDS